jgi:uncharacterized protein (DUF4415 family)
MKKTSLPTSPNKLCETTYTVTEEHYRQQKERGLDDDEILKPGTYKAVRGGFLQRHPELLAAQKISKVRVTMFLDQDIVEAFKRAAEAENALPYQTQINLALRQYLQEQSLSLSPSDLPAIQTLARAIAQELHALAPKRK